jgi:hypothetical protein
MLLMLGVFDRREELLVAGRTADIIGWSCTCAAGAERIVPVGVGVRQWPDSDPVASTVTEVVFVDELVNAFAECSFEGFQAGEREVLRYLVEICPPARAHRGMQWQGGFFEDIVFVIMTIHL